MVFHSKCTNLHSHRQCTRAPLFHILTCVVCRLLDDSHSGSCEVISHFVLICISLIITALNIFFMCLLVICMSSLEKYLLRSSVHFLIGLFFLILSCINCLYILDIKPLLVISFANIFSYSASCLFVSLMASIVAQKLWS